MKEKKTVFVNQLTQLTHDWSEARENSEKEETGWGAAGASDSKWTGEDDQVEPTPEPGEKTDAWAAPEEDQPKTTGSQWTTSPLKDSTTSQESGWEAPPTGNFSSGSGWGNNAAAAAAAAAVPPTPAVKQEESGSLWEEPAEPTTSGGELEEKGGQEKTVGAAAASREKEETASAKTVTFDENTKGSPEENEEKEGEESVVSEEGSTKSPDKWLKRDPNDESWDRLWNNHWNMLRQKTHDKYM